MHMDSPSMYATPSQNMYLHLYIIYFVIYKNLSLSLYIYIYLSTVSDHGLKCWR